MNSLGAATGGKTSAVTSFFFFGALSISGQRKEPVLSTHGSIRKPHGHTLATPLGRNLEQKTEVDGEHLCL